MAIIDRHVVRRMLVARLQSVGSAAGMFYVEGEQIPENLDQWFTLGSLQLQRDQGGARHADDIDQQSFTAEIAVHVSGDAARGSGQNLLEAAAAEVARYLDRYDADDVSTTHKIVVMRVGHLTIGAIDDARAVRVGTLTVEGQAWRITGETFEVQTYTAP